MARNARDSNIALQAAEAALRDAEADVSQTRALSGATLFSTSCDQSGGKGLCMPATTGTQHTRHFADREFGVGHQAQHLFCMGQPVKLGTSLRAGSARYLYRFTSLGYGALAGTRVMLQEYFRP